MTLDVGFPCNLAHSKYGLKITQYITGLLGVNHATSYAISNPPVWATRSPKGFGIHPCRVKKRGTFVLRATLGHTVEPDGLKCIWLMPCCR